MKSIIVAFAALCLLVSAQPAAAGTLYAGTDTEEFSGTFPPDRLARGSTLGAGVAATIPGGFAILNPIDAGGTFHPVNGMGAGPGFLFAGQPRPVPLIGPVFPGNTLRTMDFNANVLTTLLAGFPVTCCNEEMVLFGGNLLHVNFKGLGTNQGLIQEINPNTGMVISSCQIDDIVGAAVIGAQVWITRWAQRQVGTWNQSTCTFVPVFSSVPINAGNTGCLAFDPSNGTLWIGFQGGAIIPSDLAGTPGGTPVLPFGGIPDTIDGCEIFLDLFKTDVKPESNPNCVNPNSGGVISVAYFGSATFDVLTIDEDTLEWGGASPLRCALEDAVMGGAGQDGITDLVCKYRKSQVALPQSPDDCVIVEGGGLLVDGTPFGASDHVCVAGDPVCNASTPQ